VLALVSLLSCGDDVTGMRSPGASDADPSATRDAASDDRSDATNADPDVVVFENTNNAFAWDCGWVNQDGGDWGPTQYLDLTLPLAMQTGQGTHTAIGCLKLADRGNSTPGGIWFQHWADPEVPDSGVHFAAGEDFVLDGVDDGADIDVTPPLVMSVGDLVGPDLTWVRDRPRPWDPYGWGMQTAHFQDATPCTAPSQLWFTSGIVGVRFISDDGVHYGFVELEIIPAEQLWSVEWTVVRWGYRVEPDAPLTIPP